MAGLAHSEHNSPAQPNVPIPQTATASGSAPYPSPSATDNDKAPPQPQSRASPAGNSAQTSLTSSQHERSTPNHSPSTSLLDRFAMARNQTLPQDSAGSVSGKPAPLSLHASGAAITERKKPWWFDDRSGREAEREREMRERQSRELSLRESLRVPGEREKETRDKEAKDREGVSLIYLRVWTLSARLSFHRRAFPSHPVSFLPMTRFPVTGASIADVHISPITPYRLVLSLLCWLGLPFSRVHSLDLSFHLIRPSFQLHHSSSPPSCQILSPYHLVTSLSRVHCLSH